ncbi:hypothetical protein CEUSTIGMA_g13080.t1 [Chlamydomonas eustigma]|uniref:Uncharacterized protein n=1 Tax=Chlamydomonas eustigma TaxID=1157962 RepID=A0A250XRI4_9CHLO|nr:hypothetical protein CEUSTIGMA_g13080.t1 [Chlamydomonas eustigma]|eukprot:GAX85665.1 hypothetical protein CEUSTIGMA_g13080.t1 [Chlamydomonas eustigma]
MRRFISNSYAPHPHNNFRGQKEEGSQPDDRMGQRSPSYYINLMVFATVAGILSALLLTVLLRGSPIVRRFSVAIIAFEVSLVLIILSAIWQIIKIEGEALVAQQNSYNNLLQVTTCPDYWTQDGTTCNNSYIPPGGKVKYTVIGDPNAPAPSTVSLDSLNNQTVATGTSEFAVRSWTALSAVTTTSPPGQNRAVG